MYITEDVFKYLTMFRGCKVELKTTAFNKGNHFFLVKPVIILLLPVLTVKCIKIKMSFFFTFLLFVNFLIFIFFITGMFYFFSDNSNVNLARYIIFLFIQIMLLFILMEFCT